ncbi:MAG: glycosyltransferase family 2 protein [Alphaproteobacteria bacterium]|nr:glycosyltransferase family 2 protein [Alphaproteobacteria bacterium]
MKNNLIILIPAYNEEKTVDLLLNGWSRVLSSLSIDYKIMIFDDGSTDATRERVLALKKMDDNIILLPLKHCGYNKTINTIYNYSLDTEWIFQADFDDEIMPDEFLKLWKLKDDVDAVLGVRLHRQNLLRTVVSSFASFWVKFLFGYGVKDVNIPFRLLRYDVFKPLLKKIPEGTLYPNLFISAYINRYKIKMVQIPIVYKVRSFGASHLSNFGKLFKHCVISGWQLLKLKFSK